jgi:hypothetical protein
MQDVGQGAWNTDRLAPVQPSQPDILTLDLPENTESRRNLARSCTALCPGFALALTPRLINNSFGMYNLSAVILTNRQKALNRLYGTAVLCLSAGSGGRYRAVGRRYQW